MRFLAMISKKKYIYVGKLSFMSNTYLRGKILVIE